MRLIVFKLLILFSFSAFSAPEKIENVRVWAAPDNTRIVFDVTGPVNPQIISLKNPSRTVVDLENVNLDTILQQPTRADRFLQRIRASNHDDSNTRIVFDLKQDGVKYNAFVLEPNQHYGHRLVVDLSVKQTQQSQQTSPIAATSNDVEEQTNASSVIEPLEVKAPIRSENVIIAIDAGHGGDDPGARGPRGTYEKDIVLAISKKLAAEINAQQGMKAVLIREGDYYMRLRSRFSKARDHKADLFVSIHADAFTDPTVRGSSVYILSKRGASSEMAKILAEKENASDLIGGVSLDDKDRVLQSVLLDLSQTASLEASTDVAKRVLNAMKPLGKLHKRSVQSAGFAVLKSPDVPSILIETAFISNPSEEKRLLSKNYQNTFATSITKGLKSYFLEHPPEGTMYARTKQPSTKHIITRGETLSGIANRYQVSLSSLRRHNNIKSDMVRVGQVISIPRVGDT